MTFSRAGALLVAFLSAAAGAADSPPGTAVRSENDHRRIVLLSPGAEPTTLLKLTLAPSTKEALSLEITHAGGRAWRADVSSALEEIRLPRGVYRLAIASPKHRRIERAVSAEGESVVVGRLVLTELPRISGRVLNGKKALGNVAITTVAGVPLATSDRHGAFQLWARDWPDVLLFRHERFGTRLVSVANRRRQLILPDVRFDSPASLAVNVRGVPKGSRVTLALSQDDTTVDLGTRTLDGPMTARFQPLQPANRYAITLHGDRPLEHHTVFAAVAAGKETIREIWVTPALFEVDIRHEGAALANADVTLRNASWGWSGKTRTDEFGRISEPVWQLGEFSAMIVDPRVAPRSIIRESIDSPADLPWKIVVPAGHVEGTVRDEAGAPVAQARVYLKTRTANSTLLVAFGDAAGRFHYNAVAEGEQELLADAPGFLRSDAVRFALRDGEHRDVSITMRRGVSRSLLVTDSDGAPAGGAVVAATVRDQLIAAEPADAEGRATLRWDSGEPPVLYAIGSSSFAASSAGASTIRLPAAPASISIHAKTSTGVPLPGIRMLMRHEGRLFPRKILDLLHDAQGLSLRTDENGVITLEHVPEGLYEFWPYRGEEEARAIESAIDYTPVPVKVDAVAGRNVITITFQ